MRLRIAASSALVAAGALSVIAVAVSLQVHASAEDAVAALARDDLQPYLTDLRTQPDERPDPASPGVLVLVIAPTGAVSRDSMPSGLAGAARAGAGAGRAGGIPYRIAAATASTPEGVWHLWAARDLAAGDAVAGRFTTGLMAGVPVVAAATGAVAWLVATLALRPVERMRRTAERLRRGRTTELLPVGAARDELTGLARTLNALLLDLHASLEHERRLTADASHELRTPIAVLAAQVELAGSPPTPAEMAELRRSIGRLIVVADDLLELSRPERDGRRATATVGELVTEAMDAVDRARILASDDVLVDLDLAEGLDETEVCAIDRTSFARVLTNLLGNAAAATSAGSIVVGLDRREERVLLTVSDTGRGLVPEFLPVAFDRFSRSGEDHPGAGLGLAVVRRLVHRAGGTVSLGNRVSGGALACAEFPLRAPTDG